MIQDAARRIGIEEVVVREWDRNLVSSWFTNGVVREKKYDIPSKRNEQQTDKDLGYLRRDIDKGTLTARSFQINSDVFSEQRYRDFYQALKKQGLEAFAYHPFGLIFASEKELPKPEPIYK
ncbi:TPA: hypothetical protein HA242_06550 [Candidatus Woesearchaeota archaeon]|nr:hypothetical protein [Candidatus Woesearchaeota archaeon]HIG93064.1 hypothetical protein [Candidatus Woesearchaeota archaeon]HIH13355.1 hypothetical protein [Candidatus Woesearchaeota archaeon]